MKNQEKTIDEIILNYVENAPFEGMSYNKIWKKVGKEVFTKEEIIKVVNDLEDDGELLRKKGNRFFLPEKVKNKGAKNATEAASQRTKKEDFQHKTESKKRNTSSRKTKDKGGFIGIVDMTSRGSAYLLAEDFDTDIYIPHTKVADAFHGDKVRFRLSPSKRGGTGKKEGEILEVVERKTTKFVGTIEVTDHFGFFKADNKRVHVDFFIPVEAINGAKHNEKVVVEFENWPKGKKSPFGKVSKILGKAGDNDTEMKAILAAQGFDSGFPEAVEKEAKQFTFDVSQNEIDHRIDCRDITTFTIDPHDAKDFDDAISVQYLDNGNYEIGVHIADVTHYCRPGTALDDEASMRATSVYLVDRVIPMLPENLSNGVCSLRPNEDKLTFSAFFEMTPKAKVLRNSFSRTVIHSDRRFTYEEAQECIESGKGDYADELVLLNNLAKILQAERTEKGSIKFDKQEVRFKLDETGKPIDVYAKVRKDAHKLVEDFMLLANKAVATFFAEFGKGKSEELPAVFRVHAPPKEERLEQFATIASSFGHKGNYTTPENTAKTLNTILGNIKGKPEQNMLETLAIRSMSKATYTTYNIGHYGLAFENYTHFTSPIRRYPDVLVHRTLQQLLDGQPQYERDSLEAQCKYCSEQEKAAATAERDSVKLKQVEYLAERIGQQFDGVISGVMEFGIFVELARSKCEGLVRRDLMGEDQFIFNQDGMYLQAYHSRQKFSLGDKVKVMVVAANLESRTIDFQYIAHVKEEE